MMNKPQSNFETLLKRILRVKSRWMKAQFSYGLAQALVLVGAVLALEIWLDRVLMIPSTARLVVLIASGAMALGLLVLRGLYPLLARTSPVEYAADIESANPELGENLRSSTELWAKRAGSREAYSTELIDALVNDTYDRAQGSKFDKAVSFAQVRKWLGFLVIPIVIIAAGAALSQDGLARVVTPLSTPNPISEKHITVAPGDTVVISGENLAIEAELAGFGSDVVPDLLYGANEKKLEAVKMRNTEEPGGFYFVLNEVREKQLYKIAAVELESELFEIDVMERPFITRLSVSLDFPEYSGLASVTQAENTGDIRALKGTEALITAEMNKRLDGASLELSGGAKIEMAKESARTWTGKLRITREDSYGFDLLCEDGLANLDRVRYTIEPIQDEYPTARMIWPNEDIEMPEEMFLPIRFSAVDDYGLSLAELRYQREGEDEVVIPLESWRGSSAKDKIVDYEWDLSAVGVLPGMTVGYFVRVYDNDVVSGPKFADTKSFIVRFPSMEELYSDIEAEQEQQLYDLEEVYEERRQLKEHVEKLAREINKDLELDWQRREQVEDAMEKHVELKEKLKDISQQLDETSQKMQQSDLIALETIEKMEEISELMHELASDEMKEVMDRLQEAMDKVDPDKVQQALKKMDVSQEETLKRLERTIEMLKRVRAERQMEAAVEKARRLMRDQERLAEKTERADSEQMDKLAQEQEALKQQLDEYMKQLEELAKNLDDIDPEGAKETREAAQQCQNQQIAEDMQQAANNLKQENKSQASESQQQAADKLRGLFQKMRQCQGGCQMRAQGEALAEMERAIRNLLGISKAQEDLISDIAESKSATRSSIQELTDRQTDLMQSTKRVGDDMYELSKKTMFITPQIMRSIAQALAQMQQAGFNLEQTRSPTAITSGERAMSSLNQAVIALLESQQSCSSCGQSGSQLSQMLQQLRQMSDRQGDLNQAMEELLRQMDQMSEMNPGLMETLARLRAEQMSLEQTLQQLGKEYGERKEVLGRLDSIGEEMKKVIKEMEEQRVSQGTIEKQRRILSRLLDAQLSLTKRDFTRKRISTVGQEYLNRTSPPSIADELGSEEEIREDLLRALKGNFAEEYRDLIKAYFQELSRKSAEAGG
jgi:hypothetical protein